MGGGVAVAFSAQFPYLTTDRLALIAPTGLLDVGDSYESIDLKLNYFVGRRHFTYLQVSVFSDYADVDVELAVPCKWHPPHYMTLSVYNVCLPFFMISTTTNASPSRADPLASHPALFHPTVSRRIDPPSTRFSALIHIVFRFSDFFPTRNRLFAPLLFRS